MNLFSNNIPNPLDFAISIPTGQQWILYSE